jgi:myosin heavy subunit
MTLVEELRYASRSAASNSKLFLSAADRIEELEAEVIRLKTEMNEAFDYVKRLELEKAESRRRMARLVTQTIQRDPLGFNFHADTNKQLAAAQAENQKLREALGIAEDVFRDYARLHAEKEPTQENAKKVERNLHYSNICKEALSTTPSTEALDEYFTKRLNELMEKVYPSANGKGVRE